jgi:hypothetical protein
MADIYRDTLRDSRTGFIDPEWVSISVSKVEFFATGLRR